MSDRFSPWRVRGPYFEACNCEAICPCRRVGGGPAGRPTHETCDFALGWSVEEGHAGATRLTGLQVVMAGSYASDEAGRPWRVALYVDERADDEQHAALEAIFLGRLGGTVLSNFARNVVEVYDVRRAAIAVEHVPGRRRIAAGEWVEVLERGEVGHAETVTCGIPGHDRPGREVVAERLSVRDGKLVFSVRGRCGFASDFDYRSGP